MAVFTPTAVVQARDLAPTAQGGALATGPAANASLVTVALPNTNALYEVTVYAFLSGTVTATDASNMVLKQGATTLSVLPVAQAVAAAAPPVPFIVNSALGSTVNVSVGAATPGASCGYNAIVVARQISF